MGEKFVETHISNIKVLSKRRKDETGSFVHSSRDVTFHLKRSTESCINCIKRYPQR